MTNDIIDGSAPGSGVYKPFKALWHLRDIGVLEDLETYNSPAWDRAHARVGNGDNRTRVAMIDTSVAAHHPNLEGAIAEDLGIDFFSSRLGIPGKTDSARLKKLVKDDKHPLPRHLPSGAKDLWDALVGSLKTILDSSPEETGFASEVQAATRPSFSAHGTAMAGLIGARPLSADASKIAKLTPDEAFETNLGFSYAGVDPFCEVVPISTNFDPEPEQLILTILYAVLIEAHVIVLARDFPTP